MKKILICLAIFAALAACKNEEKPKEVEISKETTKEAVSEATAPMDAFVEKSWEILESKFKDSPVSKWAFDGETQKSGDSFKAEFLLPKRKLVIGDLDTSEYTVSFNLPENMIKATALEDDKVLLTSQIDLSQYSLSPIQFGNMESDDFGLYFSMATSGLQDNKEIYHINTKRKLESEIEAKDITFNYDYKISGESEFNQAINGKYIIPQSYTKYVITPAETVSDMTYANSIKNARVEQKQTMIEAGMPINIEAIQNYSTLETNIDWKGLGNQWFDTENLWLCFNDAVSFNNEEKMLTGANCFWSIFKNTPLGQMKLVSNMPEAALDYKIDLTSLKQSSEFAKFANSFNSESIDFSIKTDMNIKADIDENDGLVALSFFEALNNISLTHNLDVEALKAAASTTNDAQMIESFFKIASELAIEDIEFEMGGKVKRAAFQAVDKVENKEAWDSFDLGRSAFNMHLYIMTAKGFIDAAIIWESDKETLAVQQITEEDILTGKLVVKIQNFDDITSIIEQFVPQAQFLSALIKSLGKTSEEDASVLIFELTMNESGQPLINGTPLPFM